jgi:aryl-alcohol dehydrogenase-like predicted oxidoreductase
LDSGINFIDTADMYDRGKSEEFVGRALKGKRTRVLVASKFSFAMGDTPNERGASRWYITRAIEASLRRLNTDYLDLYQYHFPDPSTPIAETLRALDDLVKSGKVRYIGCTNFAGWQISEAQWTSRVNHLHSFVTMQAKYNLLERQIEQEIVPCCRAHGLGIIPWGPLAGGFLTGKYRKEGPPLASPKEGMPPKAYNTLYKKNLTEANWAKLAELNAFAKDCGHKVGELAIAWLLSHPWVSTVIVGATKTEQILENVNGASWKMTPEEISRVDQI